MEEPTNPISLAARFVSKQARPALIYEQLSSIMRERIVAGDLPDGYRLTSEKDLARQSGVSRSTVREALRVLEQSGFVERLSPKVMVVRRRPEEPEYREVRRALRRHKATVGDLVEGLIVMEPPLAALAAAGADADDVRKLADVLGEMEHAQTSSAVVALDVEFHSRLAEISGNSALAIARAPIVPFIEAVLYRVVWLPGAREALYAADKAVYDRVRVGDEDGASRAARDRLTWILDACKAFAQGPHPMVLDLPSDPADWPLPDPSAPTPSEGLAPVSFTVDPAAAATSANGKILGASAMRERLREDPVTPSSESESPEARLRFLRRTERGDPSGR